MLRSSVGTIFRPVPNPWWGLRGDPYLWKDLARVFRHVPLPDSEETLVAMLEGAYMALTGHSIQETEPFVVERYAQRGMSSGQVDPGFWSREALPLLRSRFFLEDTN